MAERTMWMPPDGDGEQAQLRVRDFQGGEEIILAEEVYDTRKRPIQQTDGHCIELTPNAARWLYEVLGRILDMRDEDHGMPVKQKKTKAKLQLIAGGGSGHKRPAHETKTTERGVI